jgi:hypothetical protein
MLFLLFKAIHLLGTNLQVVQTFGGFICPNFSSASARTIAHIDHTLYPTGLTHFPRLNCVVANGKPGHLQFFSFTNDKLLFSVKISLNFI